MPYYNVIKETTVYYGVLVKADNEKEAELKAYRRQILKITEDDSDTEIIVVECDSEGQALIESL